jgi:hypothetical protein
MWQIIIKETGDLHYLTNLNKGSEETFNIHKMTDMLNSFFIKSVDDILVNNINYSLTQTKQQKIKYEIDTIF